MASMLKLIFFLSNKVSKSQTADLKSTTTSIAIGSIAIGIAVIIISIFVLRGFINEIHEKSFSFSGHIIVKKFTANSSESSPISYNSDFYKKYQEIPAIKHLQGVAYKAGLIENKKSSIGKKRIGGLMLKGFDDTWDTSLFFDNLIEGKLPNTGTEQNKNDILISNKLANELSFKVGDFAFLTFFGKPLKYRKVKICGIYETGLDEFEDIAICNLKFIQSINDWEKNQVTHFEVFLKDFQTIDDTYHTLEKRADILTNDLYATRITQQYRSTFEWLNLLDHQVMLFILLIMFIATFNLASVFFVIIMDNSKKIGLLKTLGASNHLIKLIFLAGGLKTICIGLFIGNSLALTISYIQYKFKVIPLDYENYFMHHIPISWEWNAMIYSNIIVLVIILLSLLIPTHIISTIKPKAALSFD